MFDGTEGGPLGEKRTARCYRDGGVNIKDKGVNIKERGVDVKEGQMTFRGVPRPSSPLYRTNWFLSSEQFTSTSSSPQSVK